MACHDSEIPGKLAWAAVWPSSQPRQGTTPLHSTPIWLVIILLLALLTPCARAVMVSPEDVSNEAQKHANRGLELAQAGDLKGAEAELRQAVELTPDDPAYLADLGGILGMQQKLEEAGVYFEKALRSDPDNLTVRRDLAANQWQLGRLPEARSNLQRILKSKPGDRPSILLLGMVSENLKDYTEAAKLLGSMPELVKQRPESIAALARAYYQTHQERKAREVLEDLLTNGPAPQGVFLGGEVASQAGDSETALRLFGSIRSSYSDPTDLAYNMALAEYRGGHFKEAENILTELTRSGHQTSEGYDLLGWCFYKQGEYRESVRAMDHAIDLEPTRELNYLDLGQMLIEQSRLILARTVATKALERIPDSSRLYMMKGMIEVKQGDYTDAVTSYSRAVALDRTSPEANSNLAKVQWLDGMSKEAEATFESGIKRFPEDAPTYLEYAVTLLKDAENGDTTKEARAVSLLEQACALDESYSEPHYELGNLWLRKGKISEALQELQAAARLNPKDEKTHFALSRAYRHLGRSQEAAAELAAYEKWKSKGMKAE